MIDSESLQYPGQVEIKNIILVSPSRGMFVSLIDYLIELNIEESIFKPVLSGTITLSDSTNLVSVFPLIGEEYLYVDVKTPSLDDAYRIYRTFRVYGISNKVYAKDGNTLVYQLSFTSTETFNDINNPIYKAFQGTPAEIVYNIFIDYLQADRNIAVGENPDTTKNPLTLLDFSQNKIKFVSPGWRPLQCINWIASKSLPETNNSANFLFWETTKGFYYGSIGSIFTNFDRAFAGEYIYSETYINTLKVDERSKSMFAIKSLHVDKNVDQLQNSMTGYLSNRLLDIDLYNKNYKNVDYDHVSKFSTYSHLNETESVAPLFDAATVIRNPKSYTTINYSVPKLHNTVENNFDEITKYMFGNRRSNMIELNNFRMEIVVPGRTDVEVGNVIHITIPKGKYGALSSKDQTNDTGDELYSGYYLITHINHKINPKTHYMALRVTRDSFEAKNYNQAGKQ